MNNHHHNNFNQGWYTSGLLEYMLLANPDEVVGEKVMLEKEYFEDHYGAEIATKTLPHIIIANFFAKERMETLLCRWLQNACSQQYSFTVTLNNFSGFPSHAIFIRVQNPKVFGELTNNIRVIESLLQSNGCPPLQFADKPHMTIARQLDEAIYNKAIIDYAQRTFHESFTLSKLTLLKRESLYKNWQPVTNFHLPVERTLFN